MAEEKEKDDEDEGHKDKVEKSTRGKHVDEVEGVPPGCFFTQICSRQQTFVLVGSVDIGIC